MDQSALDALLHAAVVPEADHRSGKVDRASEILAASPDLAGRSIFAAAALGDVVALRAHLSRDPSLAVARGGARGWSPLLYLTFSLFLRDCPERAEEFASCARLLLEHGADANDYWISQSGERESAIYGAAGLANCPAVTRLLLDAGAKVTNPPDNEVLYHTAEHREHSCLRLILSAGPDADSLSYCMCHKMDQEDPEGLRLFISAGADVNYRLKGGVLAGYRPLHFAIFRRRSLKVMRILLDAGADPNLPADNGITPIQLAQRHGLSDVVELMREHGGRPAEDAKTRLLYAVCTGDEASARQLLAEGAAFSEEDHHLLVDAAEAGNVEGVRLMLKLGFPQDTRRTSYGGWDGPALHYAAWHGHAEIVQLLIDAGADVRATNCFGSDALGTALHGLQHAGHSRGDEAADVIRKALQRLGDNRNR